MKNLNLKGNPVVNLKFILIFMTCWILIKSQASHITGGEISYKHLGNNSYQIRLDLYIDCKSGFPNVIAKDSTVYIAFFSKSSGKYLKSISNLFNSYKDTFKIGNGIRKSGEERISSTLYPCADFKSNACIDHFWYTRTVYLPPIPGGYIASFQRCCRSGSILNINDPGNTGANFWATIPNPLELPNLRHNSTPIMPKIIPNLCKGYPARMYVNATDPDGDSLSYEFCDLNIAADTRLDRPDNANAGKFDLPPFRKVNWIFGYSPQIPIRANPEFKLDATTGFIYGIPISNGQYSIGIKVKEFRNRILINETIRDFQFTVSDCDINLLADFYNPKIHCGRTVSFKNKSIGAKRMHWNFGEPSIKTDTSNLANPTYTFSKKGKYKVVLKVYDSTCVDSILQTIEIIEPMRISLGNDTTICHGDSVKLTTQFSGADSIVWIAPDQSNPSIARKEGIYIAKISMKACVNIDTLRVKTDAWVDLGNDTVICRNDILNLKLDAGNNFVQYDWNTGEKSKEIIVKYPYKYSVKVITKKGCISTDTIQIDQLPEIKSNFNDTIVCAKQPVFKTIPGEIGYCTWNDGDHARTKLFSKPGNYWIKLEKAPCIKIDSFLILNYPSEIPSFQPINKCGKLDTIIYLDSTLFSKSFWQNNNQSSKIRITQSGNYPYQIITKNNCVEADTLQVRVFNLPNIKLPNDTVACASTPLLLCAPNGMKNYIWNTGSNSNQIVVDKSAVYFVTIIDKNNCQNTDTIKIEFNPLLHSSNIFFPNAFTPDNNLVNDFFPDNQYKNFGPFYLLQIYNTYGAKVFETRDCNSKWNGNYQNKPAPQGMYIFKAHWIGCNNALQFKSGPVLLMR